MIKCLLFRSPPSGRGLSILVELHNVLLAGPEKPVWQPFGEGLKSLSCSGNGGRCVAPSSKGSPAIGNQVGIAWTRCDCL